MKWAVIATWKMSYEGVRISSGLLKEGKTCAEAALAGVTYVEDNPEFHSVGYGGLPDEEGHVRMDGGFMDGDTLHFGAVSSIEGFRSPARIAYSLKEGDANNFLTADGAEKYAEEHGFEKRDNRTEEAMMRYYEEYQRRKVFSAYDGHDTVCFLVKDANGSMCASVSTSGLFMKKRGRVGDSPMPGNGYYADSEIGAGAATGMGEEICKGALSFAVTDAIRRGIPVQTAAQKCVQDLNDRLVKRNGYAQPLSVIALDKEGNWGVGTNVDFDFAYASDEQDPVLYHVTPEGQKLKIERIPL